MKWSFSRRPGAALRRGLAAAAILLAVSCGGSDAPHGPSSPSPPPSSSPQASGAIVGPYVFEVRPAAACGMSGALTFPMTASASGASGAGPYPGVEVVLSGAEALELELQTQAATVTGGFGTTENGVLANESIRLVMHAMGAGPVTRATDGRGQIASGTLAGYIAFANAGGQEGSLGSCDSTAHTFALRAR